MKVKNSIYGIILLWMFSLVSCTDGYKTLENGLKYKLLVENKDAPKGEIKDIYIVSMRYSTLDDSIIYDNKNIRLQFNTPTHDGGCLEDALSLLHVGDSGSFIIDAEGFYVFTRKMALPGFLKEGDKLKFDIKLKEIIRFSDFQLDKKTILSENSKEESVLLDAYLKRTNVTVAPSSSGLYYIEKKKGIGPKPVPGKRVWVHYLGYFIDGKLFDNSYERGAPFVFRYGNAEVIQGWEEGLSQMAQGGSALLVIPSHLAYGDNGKGKIPAFSTLIFEIELIKVEQ